MTTTKYTHVSKRHAHLHTCTYNTHAHLHTCTYVYSDSGGFTPLINAAWHGDHKICAYLLQRGADLSVTGSCANPGSLVTRTNIVGPMKAVEWAYLQKHPKLGEMLQKAESKRAQGSSDGLEHQDVSLDADPA
jgi:hypothetical protein